MNQDDNNSTAHTTAGGLSAHSDQTGQEHSATGKTPTSGLSNKVAEEIADVSAALQAEDKTAASDIVDLVKHPSRYAELGASLAEGLAGESLGEILGAGAGTVFGPEGTVIGAEVGGMIGEALGAHQGSEAVKELQHQPESGHSLTEELQKEGSAKAGEHAGKLIGGMLGTALFDEAGGDIGEKLGDKIGKAASGFVFEHVEKKKHGMAGDEPPADDNLQSDSKEP